MTIAVSDTLIPGGSSFGIIRDFDQVGGWAAMTNETLIGNLASGKLVLNGTWRTSLSTGVTYLYTSSSPSGGFGNGTWTPVAAPTSSGSWSPGVLTVATANVTPTNEQTINGVTTSNSRILLVAQTTSANNGIWVTQVGGWQRATDANTAGAFVVGKSVDVTGGTFAGAIYICTQAPTTLNTDPIQFVVNSQGATVNWGSPGAIGSTVPNTIKTTALTNTTGTVASTSSDGNNPMDEQRGVWVALTTDSATTVLTLPNSIAVSNMATISAEVWITKDGASDFGVWRRTIFVRNVASTLQTPTGGSTDVDLSPVGNLGTGVNTATSKIDLSTNPPTIKVTRPTGIACHARVEVMNAPRGWSGV